MLSKRFAKGGEHMDTGLFRLFRAVNDRAAIADYLNDSSYDELIECSVKNDRYTWLFHTAKKYASVPAKGSCRQLPDSMAELLLHPDDRDLFRDLLDPAALPLHLQDSAIEGLLCGEFRFRLLNGGWCWVELVVASGSFLGLTDEVFHLYIYDVHSRKTRELGLNETNLYSVNNRNETTGLLHKRAFIKEAEKLRRDVNAKWCLIAIDIDNFKLYNEWYGHSAGDLLMARFGAKLRESGDRFGGTAGYFGQDDFCLMLPYDPDEIKKLYEDIAALVSSDKNDAGFKPAFGVSIVDGDSQFVDIIDRAFLAVRVAKQSYRRRIRLFDPGMYSQEDAEYRILANFMRALKRQEIVFYLQPQCRASTGRIVSAEALCRWILPDGEIVPPGRFIPVLEKHGLITDLDLYIWEAVCRWQWMWINKGNTPLPVCVNVSAMDIMNVNLTEVFVNLTEKYRLSHDLIKIEITESAYSCNTTLVKNTVHDLRQNGFTVLMDDFGSGYSTLNMLKNLSVDILKLDAQFLNVDENDSEKSIRIIESVATMAKTLGLPIIVEGVENEEQKKFLEDLGCRYIQGYHFYRPMTTEAYEELIADNNNIDTSGITFKANQQFRLREILDKNVYSDNMLNNILGPCAFYSWHGEDVDIIRFNQQFYQTVDVPDFMERLVQIQRFLPPLDVDRMQMLLQQAKDDRLNGSNGILHFYKTDGTLTTYIMRFYYLRREEDRDIFYGAVQDITRLSRLEKQIMLLARYSKETIIFLTRKPDSSVEFSVLFNALEKEADLTREQLEQELNDKTFFRRIDPDDPQAVYDRILQRMDRCESFKVNLHVRGADDVPLKLVAYGDYVIDDTDTMDYIITLRKYSAHTVL